MRWVAASALLAALAIAAGAFGAHALAARLAAREIELWQSGARYLTYAALAGLALGAVSTSALAGRGGAAIAFLLGGGVLFAGSLFALALGGPRLLGALTPLGGIAMIGGLTAFALIALRSRP